MVFKIVLFAALATFTSAGHLGYVSAPGVVTNVVNPVAYASPVVKTVVAEDSAPAHYDFAYSVDDPITGDHKSQHESRRGDVVQGSYSLLDSDGTKRTVDYAADAHSGFNAVVRKEPVGVAVKSAVVAPAHVAVKTIATPTVAAYASPVIASHVTPVVHSYAAPAYAGYAAPGVRTYSSSGSPYVARFAAPAVATYSASPLVQHSPYVANYAAVPGFAHGFGAVTSYSGVPVISRYH